MRYRGDPRTAHLQKLPPVAAIEDVVSVYDEDVDVVEGGDL